MIPIEQIKEYTKSPQFGDKDYGKWGALRIEQRKAYRDLIDIIEGMEQEIERLNNIINELEKWLKEKQILYGINQQGFSWGVCGEALDKLQELKGSE